MKALILKDYNHFEFEEVPEPVIAPDEVIIRVKACGICGSDVHGMDGSTGRRIPPLIMGHEAAGIITDVGSRVKNYSKGDRVTFDSTIYCGECHFCSEGFINLCDNRRVLGVSCDEYVRNGAFAEYVAVPYRVLYHLPETITFEQASMVEPLSIAFHALKRTQVVSGDTAVVVGTGIIGMFIIQLLRSHDCGCIIAVDTDRNRLNKACELGADECISPDEKNVIEEIFNLTGGRGADRAFEVVGITQTIEIAAGGLKKGGTIILIGNFSPGVNLPLQKVVSRQLSLLGSCASCGEYPACLDMIARGIVSVDPMISVTAPLSEGAQWFRRLYDREPGLLKVILIP